MNVRRSHLNRFGLVLVLCLCAAFSAAGQLRYEQRLRENPWNSGRNAAGLRTDGASFSNAELYGEYLGGGFRSPDEAASEWKAGAQARTVTSLEKFSMRGSFGFEDREAYDECGSMFLESGRFPIDVVEFTPGRKTYQTYTMSGAVAVDLSGGWTVGAALDFESRNAAKRKDLRYTDYALDLSFSPAVMYSGEGFAAGLALIYDRNTETVSAEQIGSAAAAPTAFFDEGLCIGALQAWTGSGTRLSEAGVSGLPVVQSALGAAAQLQLRRSLYAEAEFSWLRGRVGERQTVWYRYEGPRAALRLEARSGRHALRASADWQLLSNRKTVLNKTVEGGITLTREYGSNSILQQSSVEAGLEYEYLGRLLELRAELGADFSESLTTPLYPYFYTQKLQRYSLAVEPLVHLGHFDLAARLRGGLGFRDDASKVVEGVSESVSEPYRHSERYAQLCEFATAPRAAGGLSLRWNFLPGLYTEVYGDCVKAFSLNCIAGSLRWDAGLKFGYNF